MKLLTRVAAALLFLGTYAEAAEVKVQHDLIESSADCHANLPWGTPGMPSGVNIQVICKTGYVSFFDISKKVPRLVAYVENGQDTFGCLPRLSGFHTERTLPDDNRPSSGDYAKSGYDLGHQAPDQDMANTSTRLFDSYNLVNVAPQLPKLNRQGWESLEELVRAWAYERSQVVIYVGAIVSDNAETIGTNKVAIPSAFYKIVVDPKTHESIAFIMPQKEIPKGDPTPYETTVADVEAQTGIQLTLPLQTDRQTKPTLWHGDVSAWHKAHKAACHGAAQPND